MAAARGRLVVATGRHTGPLRPLSFPLCFFNHMVCVGAVSDDPLSNGGQVTLNVLSGTTTLCDLRMRNLGVRQTFFGQRLFGGVARGQRSVAAVSSGQPAFAICQPTE